MESISLPRISSKYLCSRKGKSYATATHLNEAKLLQSMNNR
jgi:hypothetical protein